jgi:hypothetical protein
MAGRVEQVTAAIEAGRGCARFPGSGDLHRGIGVVDINWSARAAPTDRCRPISASVAGTLRARGFRRAPDAGAACRPEWHAIHRPRVPFWRC